MPAFPLGHDRPAAGPASPSRAGAGPASRGRAHHPLPEPVRNLRSSFSTGAPMAAVITVFTPRT